MIEVKLYKGIVPFRETSTGCWEFAGARNGKGYGVMQYCGKLAKPHRVAYALANGEIPSGLIVRHKCDNPPCCNPEHLELGTHKQNAEDRESRGRGNHAPRHSGAETPTAKMSWHTVNEARALHATGEYTIIELSKRYGICEKAMGKIIRRQTWTRADSLGAPDALK